MSLFLNLLLSLLAQDSSGSGYYRSPWLAKQAQLQPAYEIDGALQGGKGDHILWQADGDPVVIWNGTHQLVSLGVGGAWERLDSRERRNLPSPLQGMWASVFANGDFKRTWWIAYNLTGAFGSPLSVSEALRSTTMLGGGWSFGPSLKLGAAVTVVAGQGPIRVVPIPIFSWSNGLYSAAILPSGIAEMRWPLSKRWEPDCSRKCGCSHGPGFVWAAVCRPVG